jgi:thiol-disulfide isomerase/thioredoxin
MKQINKSFFLIFGLLCFFSANGSAQKLIVNFEIGNYQSDTLIVGNYFGEKQIVKDTLFAKGDGKFEWSPVDRPEQGMYLVLLKPTNTFVQFLVNELETKFSLDFDAKDLLSVKFNGSDENKMFYEYLAFLKDKRVLSDTLRAKMDRAKTNKTTDEVAESELDKLDKEVKKYQTDFISKHPTTITALLIKSNIEVDIPEFKGNEDSVKYKRYFYYKKHYFDNIDPKHPALIRTPFLHQKVDYYVNKLSNQQPDSLIKTLDFVLEWLEINPEAYRYYLADFLNKYAQMKMVGYDALYVHLIDKYYNKGKASWVNEENLKKMSENADDLRPILIGKKMPDIVTYKEDKTPVRLYDIVSPYTVVIFWAPDCGHCKKIMPDVVSFYKKNKDKGVKMLGICTKSGDKTNTCWPAVKEKGMEDFINTADEYGRYNLKVRIKSTPKIFILDSKKEIIIKDLPGEELDRIFNEILSFEEKKRVEKQ